MFLLLAVAALVLPACDNGGSHRQASPSFELSPITMPDPSASTSPVPPPSPPASPLPTRGLASSTCVRGWMTPPAGSALYGQPLGVIRRTTGVTGPLVVIDVRYFTGPESPPSEMGYLLEVERWYVRLYAKDDPAFQGRFLVEARRFGRGLSAAAPYDTHGFHSPDWVGFQYDSADTTPKSYPGLPGQWEGKPYDFVKGGGGLDFPGLPAAVVGCLEGT